MLTKNEISALNLSPTKKDFVQIWNELLEVAGKLSERWDPTSTNESDPGIVILKALTGIADKLNYNIDKNTLEAFMPTAAQEDSMRKLCDMLGYNVKYYRSAETEVTIKYYNAEPSDEEDTAMKSGLFIPKFTVITNGDKDVSYFTTNQTDYYITSITPTVTLPCMEGQIVKCESTTDNNVITSAQISEHNRFYLPESKVAENGIFVYNVTNQNADGTPWERVDNLNIQARGSRVFKFGYDSYESRPYIEFPEDYSELINDGLFIYYARTSGANGNVSPRTLTQLELPGGEGWSKVSAESFTVENTFAATTGANIETIKQAYNNFKKTVGTFETLVTCRDYMNKIYTMTNNIGKPYVSNILVTDIRNDLNRAVTICSCDDAGIFYKDTPLTKEVEKTLKRRNADGTTGETVTVIDEEPAINHFDLVFYPFKSYSQIKSNVKDIQEAYDTSFRYNSKSFTEVRSRLDELNIKTIAHNIVPPRENDIVSINNYLRLNAIVGTNAKITTDECTLLVETIKIALANAFNMRELDFGEEIPFESIVEVIENADPRIKVVSLNEPSLYTTFSVFAGNDNAGNAILREYAVASDNWFTEADADVSGRFVATKNEDGEYFSTFNTKEAKEIYNKLVVRNIIAGRVPLFKYNNTFKTSFSEGAYRVTKRLTDRPATEIFSELEKQLANAAFAIYDVNGETYTAQKLADGNTVYTKTGTPVDDNGNPKYPNNTITKDNDDSNITEITTSCIINADDSNKISEITLEPGEIVKFRAPNFITAKTYPAYVNYHLKLASSTTAVAKNAQARTLFDLLNSANTVAINNTGWHKVFNYFSGISGKVKNFTLKQNLLKTTEDDKTGINIEIPTVADPNSTPEAILAKSGCVKLLNEGKPTIVGITNVSIEKELLERLTVTLPGNSQFITNRDVFDSIKNEADVVISGMTESLKEAISDNCSISYEFEYIPFESGTLAAWETFVKNNFHDAVEESGTILWRKFSEGYVVGKYILEDGGKLIGFSSKNGNNNPFGLLDNYLTRLHGIYVANDLGADQKPNYIENDEEYELRDGEYLCIEYTPSTTTEEGATQTQQPVQEVHKAGTIIRPKGFETGLLDSSALASSGKSYHKQLTFKELGGEVGMFSFGANEQVEIREPSQVTLEAGSFSSSSIYVYKNFNNCPELEKLSSDSDTGKRINNSYTLQDGEYIFYTDNNKAELAYFSAGTEVTLEGRVTLPKFEVIELSTIFDSGIQEIPWYPIDLTGLDKITFQEYQYITLAAGDTIKSLQLSSTSTGKLNDKWQPCESIKYAYAGTDETATENSLPKINTTSTSGSKSGWEVHSILELNVAPGITQTLRNTDKVETSITLHKPSAIGAETEDISITADGSEYPISLKANVVCQSNTGKVKLEDLYTNINGLKSFEFKVFSEQPPAVLKMAPGMLTPYRDPEAKAVIDITAWPTTGTSVAKASQAGTWHYVPLNELTSKLKDDNSVDYDRALKLPISLLTNTYGIFSIYVKYDEMSENPETWIDALPGVSNDSIEFFNADTAWTGNKLLLKPGLNCIRVNTTCDLFIKANSTSEGALYFDNLRLVDTLVTVDENGKEQITHGLNLAQLGYLDYLNTDEAPFTVFDMRARRKRKKDLRDEALTKIKDREQELTAEFSKLAASKQKVEKIVKFLNETIVELDNLLKAEDSDTPDTTYRDPGVIKGLIETYRAVSTNLKQEIDLKAALENNKSIDDLEQRLVDILNTFTSTKTSKQELLTKLGDLRSTAIANADRFSSLPKEDILDDFVVGAESDNAALIAELKLDSLAKINAQYYEQFAPIEASLNNITEDKAAIEGVLNNLYLNKRNELLTQVKVLVEANKSESLNVSDILAAANQDEVNYPDIAGQLIKLREQIVNLDINAIISRIEFAAGEQLHGDLALLIANLRVLLAEEDTPLVTAINSVLTTVLAKTDKNKDLKVTAAIAAIQTSIEKTREARITAILNEIDDYLTNEAADYDGIITDLDNMTAEHIKDLASQFKRIVEVRRELVDAVNDFGPKDVFEDDFDIKTDYVTIPFSEEVILNTWPRYMQQKLITGVDQLYVSIRGVIKNLVDLTDLETIEGYIAETRPTLIEAANVTAFLEVLEQAKDLIHENIQNTERSELIESLATLGGSLPVDSKLSQAVTAIKNAANAEQNAVICYLLDQIQNAGSIVEKQQLVKTLSEELDKIIDMDTKLVEISASFICPSILLFESKLPEALTDGFYAKLKEYILGDDGTRATILNTQSITDDLAADLTIFKDKVNEVLTILKDAELPENWLVSEDLLATYLIPNDYLIKLRDTLNSRVEAVNIKEHEIFKEYLNKDLVTAWEVILDRRSYWLDAAGNYFKKYINDKGWLDFTEYTSKDNIGTAGSWTDAEGYWVTSTGDRVKVDVKRTTDGKWYKYATNSEIIIDKTKVNGSKINDSVLVQIISNLLDAVSGLGQITLATPLSKDLGILRLEEQLLDEIRRIDKNNEFYYNVPIEANVAIDFNEGDNKLNTLMNPAVNYDINNVNNSFVISKLDINYLTKGIQIARSSRV